MKTAWIITPLLALSLTVFFNMASKEDNKVAELTPVRTVDIAAVVEASYIGSVLYSTSANNIVLKSTGLPDHKTPYWGVGDELYEDFPEGYHANVNTRMNAHNYTMTLPKNPVRARTKETTSLGPIGMALNGVPIYNDREGGNLPLDALTITTFDYSGAHPGPGRDYHYHTTGRYTSQDDAKLIGFLRDGFPIYGRKDTTGVYPTLDTYGGHTGPTQDFPEGIYHYHASNVNYLNTGYYVLKAGSYYGNKGTFTH